MLDAHPELAIPAETHFIPHLAGLAETDDALRTRFLHAVTEFETWPDLATSRDDLRAALADVEPFTVAGGLRAFYRLYAARRGKPRWGDKTPPYCLHLATIERLLPEARFVHLIRDGRDVALSVRPLWFSPGVDVASIATDWATRVRTARAQGAALRHYLEVRFEDLVRDPARTLRVVCAFVDLPYDAAMERYHERAGARLGEVATRRRGDGTVVVTREERLAMHRLTSGPPQPARILRWQREMPAEDQRRFAAVVGDLLSDLGYPA